MIRCIFRDYISKYLYAGLMASIFSTFPALKKAAPRLSRQFFSCLQCSRMVPKARPTTLYLKAFKSSTRRTIASSSDAFSSPSGASSTLASLSKSISQKTERTTRVVRTAFFPETSDKVVAYWLLGSAASVFGIVVFGGLTRLTESGFVCSTLLGPCVANAV